MRRRRRKRPAPSAPRPTATRLPGSGASAGEVAHDALAEPSAEHSLPEHWLEPWASTWM